MRGCVADAVGGLDSNVGLADTIEAFDGGALAVAPIRIRRDHGEQLLKDGMAPDEVLVAPR